MSNLSSFVLKNTVDTATVTSSCGSVFRDGILCFTSTPSLGEYCEGGHIICKSSGINWIVSPRCAQVLRSWYTRDDANTLANTCTSCTGWFVPTCGQLLNPGYTCRQYWDLFSSAFYWTSTENDVTIAWVVNFQSGNPGFFNKTLACGVRAFRCVTY